MANGPISRIYVVSPPQGISDEVQSFLANLGLNIEVKEIPLQKYGNAIMDRTVQRKLTSAALEDVAVEDIEYLMGPCPSIVEVLSRPNNKLKWAQCFSAGVDAIFKNKDIIKPGPDFRMSRTTGVERGLMMAEYVIGHILSRERQFSLQAELQKQRSYDRQNLSRYRMLSDLTLGILGLGNIGLEIARTCKAMNMTVWAGVRDERFNSQELLSSYVDHVRPMSRLNELLQECDYLVAVLPSTPETKGLLSGNVLEPCKDKKTVLISTGRGDVIDDESLANAIREGWLGGAVLDVFNQEPLPADSTLWTLPGVTITPHVSCLSRNNTLMVAKKCVDNVARYSKGQQLVNEVIFSKGY